MKTKLHVNIWSRPEYFLTKSYVQTGKTNNRYRPYVKATIPKIKYSVVSPQECVGGSPEEEVPGRSRRTGFLISMGFYCTNAVMGAVHKTYRLYNHIHIYLSPVFWKYIQVIILRIGSIQSKLTTWKVITWRQYSCTHKYKSRNIYK